VKDAAVRDTSQSDSCRLSRRVLNWEVRVAKEGGFSWEWPGTKELEL
jgi:hypothetical protein